MLPTPPNLVVPVGPVTVKHQKLALLVFVEAVELCCHRVGLALDRKIDLALAALQRQGRDERLRESRRQLGGRVQHQQVHRRTPGHRERGLGVQRDAGREIRVADLPGVAQVKRECGGDVKGDRDEGGPDRELLVTLSI